MSKKLKEKKKKDREKSVQNKLMKQRQAATAKRQTEMKEFREERFKDKEVRKFQKDQDRFDEYAKAFTENLDKLPKETKDQILHNLKILKAMEDEYKKEQEGRKATNDKLESEGHGTLSDKLNALHTEIAKQQGLLEHGQCEHAGCACEHEHFDDQSPEESPSFIENMNSLMNNLVVG